MTEPLFLESLGLIVVGAALFAVVARTVRMPSIVAYILAGLALGPVTGLVAVTEVVELISEVGIALLLFIVGLELSFARIRDVGKVAILAGLGQVAFTAAGGYLVASLLGFQPLESIFIATALTFSSTVVVVKLLDQKGEFGSLYGRIAVGIFLVQDLVVIVALTFLAGLGRPEARTLTGTLGGLGLSFAGMGVLLGAALWSARHVVPRLFGWISASLEAMFIWSLCWCFLFVLAAEAMGLSLEVGAFLAGISLAQLPYNRELRRRVHPLMNFFIAVFFVTLGTRMDPADAAGHWPAAIALSAFVLAGKPPIFLWIIARLGYSERTSFLTSVTVAQISEFSFIFAALGLESGLIDESILAVIAVVGLVTIAASSYMIIYNHELYALVRRWRLLAPFGARREAEMEAADAAELRDHVIVVGMNALGRRIVNELAGRGERVLAIDTDPRKLLGLPCATVLGNVDYLSVLEEANLEDARLLVSALQIEDTNNLLAYRCQKLGVPCSIHGFDQSVVRELRSIGADHLILSKSSGLRRVAARLREEGLIAP